MAGHVLHAESWRPGISNRDSGMASDNGFRHGFSRAWNGVCVAALALSLPGGAVALAGENRPQATGAWTFAPEYSLPRRAATIPASAPVEVVVISPAVLPPVNFLGMTATDQKRLEAQVGAGPFTVELWVVDHVNQPVAALLMPEGEAAGWVLGYRSGEMLFGPPDAAGNPPIRAKAPKGFKGRWHNLVGVWDGARWSAYINGQNVGEATVPRAVGQDAGIVLNGYLASEPYMTLPNLVHAASVYNRALSPDEIKTLFDHRARLVGEGRLVDGKLHFTQPPYLNVPTTTSIELSWETDRPTAATVEWGETAETMRKRSFAAGKGRLGGLTLDGLKADTPYFYRVTATDAQGNRIDSGLLSFRSAPDAGMPFTIAVSADTEARPHINNRMSQLIWEERPNLLLLAGDLTDGGSLEKRFEWTHEYFTGMGPLFGRVPVVAAAGNGEAELAWFRHYHRQPGDEAFFNHVYGDVEIFVLDTNLTSREKREPGFRARQKQWLEQALAASSAKWKFVMHYHAVWSTDEDDYGDSWSGRSVEGDRNVQAELQPLYEKYGVDLVIVGHLHTYERSWPLLGKSVDMARGVTYVQVGGMGGNLEDFQPTKPGFNRKAFRNHHYMMIRGAGDRIDAEVYDAEGRMRDSFVITARNR